MSGDSAPVELPEYWDIIRFNAADFLTLHPSYESRLYRNRVQSALRKDLARGLRGLLGGAARTVQGVLLSRPCRPPSSYSREPYLLLITVGGAKYAGEERVVVDTCRQIGVAVRTVHVSDAPDAATSEDRLQIRSTLRRADHVRAFARWLHASARGFRQCLRGDGLARSLFVASIPAIRQYVVFRLFAHRIVTNYGVPAAVLSLAPWTALSVALVEHMKEHLVPTGGIRTQTTYAEPEHAAINTDVLFCKSLWERDVYRSVIPGSTPALRDGCLLSLPDSYDLEPIDLPQEYTLVLEANPADGQSDEDRQRYQQLLRRVALSTGRPIVYKEHHPSENQKERSLGQAWAADVACAYVSDTRRNRDLIDQASIIVSAPSTLLYYAVLVERPVVIVEPHAFSLLPDEFGESPIPRIAWGDTLDDKPLDWTTLQASSIAASRWFRKNYFLEQGPSLMIRSLLGYAQPVIVGDQTQPIPRLDDRMAVDHNRSRT